MGRHRIVYILAVTIVMLTAFSYRTFAAEPNIAEDISKSVEKLEKDKDFNLKTDEYVIIINPEVQELYLVRNGIAEKTYQIATSRFGIGNIKDGHKTPYGVHRIKEKIGDGMPIGTAFKGRKKLPKIATISTKKGVRVYGAITTRIMWLDGQEEGINRGKNSKGIVVDSHARYIYIHGVASEGLIGAPASVGCIEMKNTEVIELFNIVPVGTLVEIWNKESKIPPHAIKSTVKKKPVAKTSQSKKSPVKKSTKKKSGR